MEHDHSYLREATSSSVTSSGSPSPCPQCAILRQRRRRETDSLLRQHRHTPRRHQQPHTPTASIRQRLLEQFDAAVGDAVEDSPAVSGRAPISHLVESPLSSPQLPADWYQHQHPHHSFTPLSYSTPKRSSRLAAPRHLRSLTPSPEDTRHDLDMGWRWLVPVLLLSTTAISLLVNRLQPTPFIDEIFHIPQALSYLVDSNFTQVCARRQWETSHH